MKAHNHPFIQPTKFNRFGNFAPPASLPLVLIIENKPDVAFYLRSNLKNSYQVEITSDGQNGIEKAIELVPDIIISNVTLPKTDGYKVCATLKRNECTSHIPIILLKESASNSDKLTGMEHGANAFLAQPFHSEELLLQLKKLIVLNEQNQQKYKNGSAYWQNISSMPNTRLVHPEENFFNKINNVIQDCICDENFGIVQLSEKMAMTRNQIHRKIKALTSLSTSIYIWTFRLYKAKEFLKTTDLTIAEIANKVSFKNPNYFIRAFKEEFHAPPSMFRKHLTIKH